VRILYALTAYPPATGGAQTHFHEIARRLVSRHEPRVACHWRENRTDWLGGVTWNAPGCGTFEQDGVPVHQVNLDAGQRRALAFWARAYYLAMGASVRRISEALEANLAAAVGPVDLVHAGRIGREFLAWAAFRLARRLGVPFVLTPFHHPRWSGWRWRWYTRLYRFADALLALTAAEKDQLTRLGVAREKIYVVGHAPLVPDLELRGDYFGPGGPVVLFLGQKYAYKGLKQLLRSMPLVWRARPEVRFAFLGPRTGYSRRKFARLRDPRVIEQDLVPEQEKLAALAACTIFCLPSRQESFGGVFAEAWRLGKPVVGGNIPAVAEIIRPGVNGELVGTSPRQLAGVLLSLLADPSKAERYGHNGRQTAERDLTWEAVVERVERVYRTLREGVRP